MRRKMFLIISMLVLSSCLLGLSQAAMVVDTGPGPNSGDSWFLDSIHRAMAGKFTTTHVWNITSVEAWMQLDQGGSTYAVIYNNDGDGTIPGSIRFSQDVSLAANPVAGWRGVTGLNWSLPAGTYWGGFGVDTPGIEGIVYYPAVSPLAAYAANIIGTGWFSATGLDLGFRIQGNPPSLTGSDMLLIQ